METEIRYQPDTRDYALFIDGAIAGFYLTIAEAAEAAATARLEAAEAEGTIAAMVAALSAGDSRAAAFYREVLTDGERRAVAQLASEGMLLGLAIIDVLNIDIAGDWRTELAAVKAARMGVAK